MITDYQLFRLENAYQILRHAGLDDAHIITALKAMAHRIGVAEQVLNHYLREKGLC